MIDFAGIRHSDGRFLAILAQRGSVYVDMGYRGHNAPKPLFVLLSGQKRGVFGTVKRELRRRSAIEAVIGHFKVDSHLGRNFLNTP